MASGQDWGVAELRRYRLHPGRREDLIDLFDRHFVEPQEDVGMRVLGQFRDVDDPDRFVWLRAFPDMDSRATSLSAFYHRHPAWRTHREAANDTMADSDDVLLLRPVANGGPLLGSAVRPPLPPADDVPAGSVSSPGSVITVDVHHVANEAALREFTDFFAECIRPVLTACGAPPWACFRTEPAENTFPALPVRTGEYVFVQVQRFSNAEAHRQFLDRLAAEPGWRDGALPELTGRLARPVERLRLTPTARSALR